MKRFTFFSLMSLTFSLAVMSQNQVVDDVYFNPKDPESVHPATQSSNVNSSSQKPNYKNGALEIVFKERKNTAATATYSSVARDTVYVVGQSGTNKSSKPTTLNAAAGLMIVHDTIYVSEILLDSLDNNTEKGYYLNGFNGTETDKEYAERIRRFHNPKYTVFIGDPRYNDIFFLNNIDWNVYLDGSFAYVTPTWTNPYWWNYSFSPFGGYGGFGGYGLGRSFYSPFYGYNNFYDSWGYSGFYGGLYGYGNYWDSYSGYGGYGYGGFYNGYGSYGGLYGGYGSYYGYGSYNRNKNYDEQTRRATNNYGNRDSRLGGTRTDAASSAVTSGGGGAYSTTTSGTTPSRNKYTVLSGTRSDNSANNSSGVATRGTMNSVDRTTSTQTNGIGVVRSTFSSGRTEGSNAQSPNRSSSTSINTRPRTFTTTTSTVPTSSTSNNTTREANPSTQSSYRNSSGSVITRSTTMGASSTTVVPSRESYVSGGSRGSSQTYTPSTTYSTSGRSSSTSSTPSYTPSYSTSSSSSSSSSSNSSSGGGGGDRSSSSGGGRR